MKKLGLTLLLAALVAFVAVATASARGGASTGSAVTAPQSSAHGDDGGPGHGGDDHGDRGDDHGDDHGDRREAGEDIRGNCDEAEHAADAACAGASATTTSSTSNSTSDTSSNSSSGQGTRTARATGKLLATVGPGFAITLRTATGAAVRTLRPGTYTVVVRDRSAEHNFHLTGRGFDRATGVGAAGTATWRVKLARGTYTYKCDPHAQVMRGSLRVA